MMAKALQPPAECPSLYCIKVSVDGAVDGASDG